MGRILKGLTKRATEFHLNKFSRFQTVAGSENRSEYKTVYYCLTFHFESLTEEPLKGFKKFLWSLKQRITKTIKNDCFSTRYLTDIQISDSFKDTGLSCVKIEFTFYPNDYFTKEQLTETLNYLSEVVEKYNFSDNEEYKIYKTLMDLHKFKKKGRYA
jgi:hypothetical protein